MVSEFHLEALCREIILNGIEIGPAKRTLKHWNTLARVINDLRDLEEFIASRYRTSALLMQDLHRMAHRQFPWQAFRPSAVNITRYYMIYEHPLLKRIIQKAIGLSPEELFLYGMALLGNFMQAFALHYPPNIQIPGLSPDGLDRFLHHFSRNLSDLKKLLLGEYQMNDRFAYAYNSLRAYPVIEMIYKGNNSLVCPIPTLLFWRFTSGVYYEIYNQSGFENAFGTAFQWYVGRILEEGTRRDKTRIYPERQYRVGKDLKRTVDWIMEQDGAAIFVEAKAKRLAQEAKVEIIEQAVLPRELSKLAAMIVQVYKSIRDYRTGCYPDYPFDAQRKIYPMVVTLEDWYLMGPKLVNKVKAEVAGRMEAEGLPLRFLEEMPFSVCAVHEFEQAVQVMDVVGILNFMHRKVHDSRQEWTLSAFLREQFQEHVRMVRFLFQREYDAIGVTITGDPNPSMD